MTCGQGLAASRLSLFGNDLTVGKHGAACAWVRQEGHAASSENDKKVVRRESEFLVI